MSLKYGILGLLNYGSMTGYDLDKAFKHSISFFWQAQTSQIYRELGAMEKIGWIECSQVLQHDKPNKKIYTISQEGIEQLKKWILQLDNQGIRSDFLMKLFFAGENGKEGAITLLNLYISANKELLEGLSATNASIASFGNGMDKEKTIYWEITADYGVAFGQMNISWAEKTIERLEKFYENTGA